MPNKIDGRVPRRRTKIVATIGPASRSRDVIRELIKKGMNVARLNFSHGTHGEHREALEMVREESEKLGCYVSVFQDLAGPKLRIGELHDGSAQLEEGQNITIRYHTGEPGNAHHIFVDFFDPVKTIKPHEKVLLSDGQIELVATEVSATGVHCTVRCGGTLRSRSGIALPDSRLELPPLTDQDLKDIRWGVENKIDYIALSFVGHSNDVLMCREKIRALGDNIPIIAKIERASSLDDLPAIVDASDVVMVARGDLGLEVPLERVPTAQKHTIDRANSAGTPVIVATQMLMSMVHNLRPTRAEVSDVCTAVRDGAGAVMLSEETAIGKHPVQAVEVLGRIIQEAEEQLTLDGYRRSIKSDVRDDVPDSICYAACSAADKISAAAIVACTLTGSTAKLVSKYRPRQPIFGITTEPRTLARMSLYWGVTPIRMDLEEDASTEDEVNAAMIQVRDEFGIKPGARVVITTGTRVKKTGTTNILEVREIPRSLSQNLIHKASSFLRGFADKS